MMFDDTNITESSQHCREYEDTILQMEKHRSVKDKTYNSKNLH